MRSEKPDVRKTPPPLPSPSPRKTRFVYVAFLVGLVMFLCAGAIAIHVSMTNRWLQEMKSAGQARVVKGMGGAEGSAHSARVGDSCPPAKPVLHGFDSSGRALCRAIGGACADGEYIAAIDPVKLTPRCASAGGEARCPGGSYITEFMWLGEGQISFSCHSRLDPFLAWKFTPVLGSRGNE